MIVKDNGKGQVTRRNKQTNQYFLHYKQLNTFDHPYHIHKYLDSEPSTFLLVNRYIIFNKFDKHIQVHMIMIYTGALHCQEPQAWHYNGPGVTRIVPTIWPQHLFKFNSNNSLSPGHSNLGSDGRYTTQFKSPTYGLVGAISEQGLQGSLQ